MAVYTVKVADSIPATEERPSAGPVYRCIYAENGLLEVPKGMESPWEFFRYGLRRASFRPCFASFWLVFDMTTLLIIS